MVRTARRLIDLLTVLTVVCLAVVAFRTLVGPPWAGADRFIDSWVYDSGLLLSALLCLLRAALVRHERAAWLCFGIGLTCWAAGDTYYSFVLYDRSPVPFPSTADWLWLAFYVPCYCGLLLLAHSRARRLSPSTWLDGGIGALAVASVAAAIVVPEVTDVLGGSAVAVATNLAYPIADILLLTIVLTLGGAAGWRLDRAWTLLGLALCLFAISDSVYLVQVGNGSYNEGSLVDLGWPAALVLVALAARTRGGARRVEQPETRPTVIWLILFVSLAVAVETYDHVHRIDSIGLSLATATLLLAVLRLGLTATEYSRLVRRTRIEVVTDPLTRLPNRRRLLRDLDTAVKAAEGGPSFALTFFDLDGFKRYNDTFGHLAGDELLERAARRLATAVDGHGTAYRLGGDEFCVLARTDEAEASRIVGAAAGALCDRGGGFAITASYGTVMIPTEASTAIDALRMADGRMYEHKARTVRTGEVTDTLLAAVSKPDEHAVGVARLAIAVGARLGLGPQELEDLRLTAELHDVGKIAVPQAILEKRGPLDEQDWTFVRRHTTIGERILAATSALARLGPLVRASHERWDGTGYPDSLRGEEIPLISRIVFVCEAYDAMTSPRPYRVPLGWSAVVRELEQGSGTQFDPQVVRALLAAVGIRAAA
jgi:diguanylate cyclase (GGDEF)-like protein